MEVAALVAHAPDGTPLYAPRGELLLDAATDELRCHLCGERLRFINPAHLRRAHGLEAADEYRALAGLPPRQALHGPRRAANLRRVMRHRMNTDERIQDGMRIDTRMAQSGALQAEARRVARERDTSEQLAEQLRGDHSALGRARAQAYRQRREGKARELGHGSSSTNVRPS